MTQQIDIDALRRAALAATPGEWQAEELHVWVGEDKSAGAITQGGCGCCNQWFDGVNRPEDAAYIAAANPSVVLALLDRLAQVEHYSRTWHTKTEFLNGWIANHKISAKYLGMHRADILRDLIERAYHDELGSSGHQRNVEEGKK